VYVSRKEKERGEGLYISIYSYLVLLTYMSDIYEPTNQEEEAG